MKRTFMMICIASMLMFAMMSCGSKDGSKEKESTEQTVAESDQEDDGDEAAPKTEEGVIAMLQEAYADANLISQPADEMEPNIDLFGMYCSKEFNDKMEQIRAIEASASERFYQVPDELGMFVYWEGSTVSMKDVDVDIDGDTADASYYLTNGEDEMMTVVKLVYEDGKWRFNDWEQIGKLNVNLREAMDEYIETNK